MTASGVQLTDMSGRTKDHEYEGRWDEVARLLNSSPPNPPNGFLIDRRCWVLLSKQFKSGELNLERLLETLRESPSPRRVLFGSRPMSESLWSVHCISIAKKGNFPNVGLCRFYIQPAEIPSMLPVRGVSRSCSGLASHGWIIRSTWKFRECTPLRMDST